MAGVYVPAHLHRRRPVRLDSLCEVQLPRGQSGSYCGMKQAENLICVSPSIVSRNINVARMVGLGYIFVSLPHRPGRISFFFRTG